MRIAGADLPFELIDRIAEGIATWWSANRRAHRPAGSARPLPAPATA